VSCEERKSLVNDYYRYTPASKADVFEQRIGVMSRGLDELQLNISQDELTNNRGTWRSAGVQNKWSSCSGHNIYLGYNTVERYQHSDEEVILGGGLRYSTIGVELEYRQSREVDILAQQSWSGMASITTGFSADLLISGSRKKYDGVDIQVLGLGIDYYIANYQVMAITEKTEYHIGSEKLDDSTGRRYYLAYYFSKKNYIRYGYITGKELDNDGSPNPPYSKIRTVLLTAAMPISVNTTFVIELKRHDQSGYYKQNGISFSVRYSYW
jgi:YaiO family outer membrane protein